MATTRKKQGNGKEDAACATATKTTSTRRAAATGSSTAESPKRRKAVAAAPAVEASAAVANMEVSSTLRAQAIDSAAIAHRAWEIWQREGCPEGRDLEHWLQAEKELLGG